MISKQDIVAVDHHTYSDEIIDALSARSPQPFVHGEGWVLPTVCVTHSVKVEEHDGTHSTINSGTSQSVCIEMDERRDVARRLTKTLLSLPEDRIALCDEIVTVLRSYGLNGTEALEEIASEIVKQVIL